MNKIWLDVTNISESHRPAGIVRTEAECARSLLGEKIKNIYFCRYDHIKKYYYEVFRQDVLNYLERIQKNASTLPISLAESKISKEYRVRKKITQFINLFPKKIKEPTWRFVRSRKGAFKEALQFYRTIKQAFREMKNMFITFVFPYRNTHSFQNPVVCSYLDTEIFSKGDIYISLGADWNNKDMAQLYRLKQEIGFKTILCCYDIIPVKLPHLCLNGIPERFVRYITDAAWCADSIICISECSRNDLQKFLYELGAPVPELSVVRLGCHLPKVNDNAPSSDYINRLITQRYILYVSTIERRKNHETIYRAYLRLIEQEEKNLPLLIFVGMPWWGVDDFLNDLLLDFRIKKYIKILSNITDNDLIKLYQKAYFTIYPSLYEGWGLPIAESLTVGKFCLASNTSSIPEVGGDLIEYLDPWDVSKWAERLKWYFDHPGEVDEKSSRICSEYKPTFWKDTAAHIIETSRQLNAHEK